MNKWTWAFHAEETGDDDELAEEDDSCEQNETEEALQVDMQHAMEVVELSDMQDDEIEAVAVDMQNSESRHTIGHRRDVWLLKARQISADLCKTRQRNCGTGKKIRFHSRQLQQKLQDVKAKTKCFNCGETGRSTNGHPSLEARRIRALATRPHRLERNTLWRPPVRAVLNVAPTSIPISRHIVSVHLPHVHTALNGTRSGGHLSVPS